MYYGPLGSNCARLVSLGYRIAWLVTFFLQVEHRPVLPKSASWEPEAVRRKPKQVNAMIA
jgi:hypothetical protein